MRRFVVLLLALTITLAGLSGVKMVLAQDGTEPPPAADEPADEPEEPQEPAEAAQIVVLGSVANQLSYTASKQEFERRIIIESQNQVDVGNLQIFASFANVPDNAGQANLNCFIEPATSHDPLIPCQDGAPLPALSALTVLLTATLPVSGDYSGGLSLLHDQTRQSLSLTVQRAIPPLPVTVHAVETAQTTASAFRFWKGKETTVGWWMTLQETGLSEAITLDQPAFLTLSRLDSDQQTYQAERVNIGVDDCNTQKTVDLNPGEIKEVKLAVCGLDKPGRYTGQLMLSANGYQPLPSPVSVIILVREHWWRAVVLITMGVFISLGIRTYQTSGRPRLVYKRRTLILLSDIEEEQKRHGDLHPDEGLSILEGWRRRLEKLQEDLDLGETQNADRTLGEINEKLTVFRPWLAARRYLEDIKRIIDQESAKPLQERLQTVTNYLEQPATDDKAAEAATAQRNALSELQRDMMEIVRQQMLTAVTAFQDTVTGWAISPEQQEAVAPLLPELAAVEIKIGASQTSGGFVAAQAAFEAARQNYARILAQWLRQELDTVEPDGLPPGFGADNPWDSFKATIIGQLAAVETAEGAAAITAYEEAYRAYLAGMLAALVKAVQEAQVALNTRKKGLLGDTPSESDKESFNTTYGQYEETLASAKNAVVGIQGMIKGSELAAVEQAYQNALQKWLEADEARPGRAGTTLGMDGGSARIVRAALGNIIPGGLALSASPDVPGRRTRPWDRITKRLRLTDSVVQIFIPAIITILVGTWLLWGNNTTWGGTQDYSTALLWGLGLHQITGAAFQGVTDLRQRLSGNGGDSNQKNGDQEQKS